MYILVVLLILWVWLRHKLMIKGIDELLSDGNYYSYGQIDTHVRRWVWGGMSSLNYLDQLVDEGKIETSDHYGFRTYRLKTC